MDNIIFNENNKMLTQQNSFYVTLPSNGSVRTFPLNKANSYKNHLAQELRLDGDWEVGLAEFHYPQTTKSISKVAKFQFAVLRTDELGTIKALADHPGSFKIPSQYGRDDMEINYPETDRGAILSVDLIKIELPIAKYTSPNLMAELLTKQIDAQVKDLKEVPSVLWGKVVSIDYNAPRNKFIFHPVYRFVEIFYYGFDEFSRVIGLDSITNMFINIRLYKNFECQNSPELNIVNTLFVYSDIIDNDIVGDELVPLLRSINVSGEPGAIIHEAFHRIYYKRVNRSNIQTIEIQVNSEKGAEVKFESGSVIAVLHFRKSIG